MNPRVTIISLIQIMFIDACRQNWSWSELDFIRFSKINEYLPWLKCEVKFLHLHAATEKDWHRRSDHAVMSIDKLARTEIDPSLTLLRVKWVLAMTEMRSEVWWRHVFTITCSRHAATEEDWQRRLFTDTWPELKLIRAWLHWFVWRRFHHYMFTQQLVLPWG